MGRKRNTRGLGAKYIGGFVEVVEEGKSELRQRTERCHWLAEVYSGVIRRERMDIIYP